jgi:hypothetical protein
MDFKSFRNYMKTIRSFINQCGNVQLCFCFLRSKNQFWFKLCQFVWAQEVCSSHVCVTIRPVMSPPPPYHPPLNWPPYTVPPPQPIAYPPPPWATLLNATYSPPPPPSTLNHSLFIQIWFANHTIQQWLVSCFNFIRTLKRFGHLWNFALWLYNNLPMGLYRN